MASTGAAATFVRQDDLIAAMAAKDKADAELERLWLRPHLSFQGFKETKCV